MTNRSLFNLVGRKAKGEKFAVLTAYDAAFARLFAEAGVDMLLVGDSLGMVVQGRNTTLPVTLDEMIYHTRLVVSGAERLPVMVDMPFLSYNTPTEAVANGGRLLKEGGAHIVKLEGDRRLAPTINELSRFGIPVCAHLGLLPQFVHKRGYRVRGREQDEAAALLADADALVEAGADMLLLECVPRKLAAEIAANAPVPVIGIGAGPECDAQVLVCYDMLGITPGKRPSFSRNFLVGHDSINAAVGAYVAAVKGGEFPAAEHCFD